MEDYYKLTDSQWERLKLLMPPSTTGQKGRPRKDDRTMVEAMLWVAGEGKHWRNLPKEFGPQKSVHSRMSKWRSNGLLEKLHYAILEFEKE